MPDEASFPELRLEDMQWLLASLTGEEKEELLQSLLIAACQAPAEVPQLLRSYLLQRRFDDAVAAFEDNAEY